MEDHAIQFYEFRLIQKCYEALKIGISKIIVLYQNFIFKFKQYTILFQREKELLGKHRLVKDREIIEKFFGIWQKSFLISKIIQTKKNEKNNTLIYQSFRKWINFIKLRYQIKRNQEQQARRTQLISLIYWKKYNQVEKRIKILKVSR